MFLGCRSLPTCFECERVVAYTCPASDVSVLFYFILLSIIRTQSRSLNRAFSGYEAPVLLACNNVWSPHASLSEAFWRYVPRTVNDVAGFLHL